MGCAPIPCKSQRRAGGAGGPLFEDTSGKGDIRLIISPATAAISAAILLLVGVLSGLAPALRASHLDPAQALRWE